jgi:hypothetical protein
MRKGKKQEIEGIEKNSMEQFVLQIKLLKGSEKRRGVTLLYCDELGSFNLKNFNSTRCQFIQAGEIIHYNEKKYKVQQVVFKLINSQYKNNPPYIESKIIPPPYTVNCQLNVFVEEVTDSNVPPLIISRPSHGPNYNN